MSTSAEGGRFGARFGAQGQKAKKWPEPALLPTEGRDFLNWLAWYQISQSGMLPEAYSDITDQVYPWRFNNLSPGGGSVRVGEASHLFRMTRALELVEADVDKFAPLHESCLTWWLSGSAVIIGAATLGALLSQGLSWTMANCLVLPIPTTSDVIAAETPALTGSRLENISGLKGRIFSAGGTADFNRLDWGQVGVGNVGGLPLPFSVIRVVLEKFDLQLTPPGFDFKELVFEGDDDEGDNSATKFAPRLALPPLAHIHCELREGRVRLSDQRTTWCRDV